MHLLQHHYNRLHSLPGPRWVDKRLSVLRDLHIHPHLHLYKTHWPDPHRRHHRSRCQSHHRSPLHQDRRQHLNRCNRCHWKHTHFLDCNLLMENFDRQIHRHRNLSTIKC